MDRITCDGFEFFSDFDSGNLSKVESVPQVDSVIVPINNSGKFVIPEIPDVEFNIWTRPDCGGTEYENGNRTWFYFGVRASAPGLLVKLNLVDLNKQSKMYSQGMAPVYRIVPGRSQWERIRDKPTFTTEDMFTLSFKFRTPENLNSTTYFAFTYPYSYTDLQNNLTVLDGKFLNSEPLSKDDIYYYRECICKSLEGRRIDLITISSYHNISTEREARLSNLFPEQNIPRPFRFIAKKVIFVSARVHPGETPSSFVFNGLLNLLTTRDDPVAVVLRRNYVFKLVPFLNPDGVARGHYRTDTRGVNLNRVYLKPNLVLHPSVYAARALLRYYHFGFEKEDEFNASESCISDESSGGNLKTNGDNKLTKKVSTMTLEENKRNLAVKGEPETWCSKCKRNILKLEETMPGISSIIPNFNHNNRLSLGKERCLSCGVDISDDSINEQDCEAEAYPQGDTNRNESGLFLYLDMHGHASKKGIFMYGNHFDDLEQNVECMLLPKIMSLNNHNFHFTACNFTERNMYLRDRRDGMSREGSGRVAVLKMTGLIRSYTLECNYNTGRLVNVLPATIRESNAKNVHTLLVPPKYTPAIFEEVGRALGSSILDLTGQNPLTRLPCSEFHSLSGLREWLRIHCANGFGETRNLSAKLKMRPSSSLYSQGKSLRAVVVKSRSTSAKTSSKKSIKMPRSTSVPIDRKENIILNSDLASQPSCSHTSSIASSVNVTMQRMRPSLKTVRNRPKKDVCMRRSANNEKPAKSSVQRAPQSTMGPGKQKQLKIDLCSKLQTVKEKQSKQKLKENNPEQRCQLREICFIRDSEGKKVIAKYNKAEKLEDNLVVSWEPGCSNAQVFSQKRFPCFTPGKTTSETCSSSGNNKKSAFRVHNFARNSAFSKVKRNKRNLRRLAGANENAGKIDKMKKRKKLKSKVT